MSLPPIAEQMAERIFTMLIERYLEALLRKFGRSTSEAIDVMAANWLLSRKVLPRDVVLPLLEDLGRRVGAKIEVSDPLGGPS